MTRVDILIIGAGVTGAAIARELSRHRARIVLLEKEMEPAFGVSKSNSGIIHPGTQNPPDSLKGQLCVEGNTRLRVLARELGVHFQETGELIAAFGEAEKENLLRLKVQAEQLGVPGLKLVDSAWLREHEPNLNPEIREALFAPTAGVVSPYRLVYDLVENAVRNGVELWTECAATALVRTASGWKVSTSRGQEFQAAVVVNAAGLNADEVARMAGITDFSIRPRKGEEFLLDKKLAGLTRHLIFPLPTPASKGTLVIKTSDGNPMIGPTAHEARDKEDLETTDQGLETVLAHVQRLVPSIRGEDIIAYFAGLRPVAGNDFLIRLEPKAPGMITVAGIQSPGLTAAPAIAVRVAGLVREAGLPLRRKWIFRKYRRASRHLFALDLPAAQKLVRKEPAYGEIVCRCEMVSKKEIQEAIGRGAKTMDGIKFRTRAQAGRCHGSFCTTRILALLAEAQQVPVTQITKRGRGSELVKEVLP